MQRGTYGRAVSIVGLLLTLIPLQSSVGNAQQQPSHETTSHHIFLPTNDNIFQRGEELTYNVSYAGIDIGQVRIKVVDAVTTASDSYYDVTAIIDSYKGVPFVNLHTVYESHIAEPCHSHWFFSRTKDNSRWTTETYHYDEPQHSVHIDLGVWKQEEILHRDTLRIDTLSQDGLSLFFFARQNVGITQKLKIPTVVNRKKGFTHLNFTGERMKEEISFVDYPIDVVHFEGEAKFVGVFGLTGGFEGWFSNDSARVPILAKMKVLIGSVRIELMKWSRKGWNPPHFVEEKN